MQDDVVGQFDEWLTELGIALEDEDSETQIMNLPRMKQLEFVYEALKILLQDQDVDITYKLNEPFKSMGSVSAEGRCLAFRYPMWFNRAAAMASNLEVYPLTNGKLRMTFTFHGLTDRL